MRKIIIVVVLVIIGWLLVNGALSAGPDELEADSRQLFSLINQEREKLNLTPLAWDESLAEFARDNSAYMAEIDDLYHTSERHYRENIATGVGPDITFGLWYRSPGHYDAMVDANCKRGAVGMAAKLYQFHIGSWDITYGSGQGYTTFEAAT